jgi:acyl dehydratase
MDHLNFSNKESSRFKMNIYRGSFEYLNKENVKYIKKEILTQDIDTVILRIPTEELCNISVIESMGFPYIIADTLVYYDVDFNKYDIKEIKNKDLEFIQVDDNNKSDLNLLVENIFLGYSNHYNSNPYFNKTDIVEGYKEWAIGLIDEENGKLGWLVKKNNNTVGFATCTFNKDENISEGILYGVDSYAAGGGVYSDIIRFTQEYFKKIGITKMKVSTQIQNYAVQKVWSREGFALKKSYNTIHINSLLDYSVLQKKSIEIYVTKEDINNYGEISGDMNDIHFNDNYAKTLGLKGRITHGLISNAILSKFYGTIFPGKGTFFLSYKYNFYSPIYPDVKYKAEISFPFYNNRNKKYLSVVKILDNTKNICLVSYNDLIQK